MPNGEAALFGRISRMTACQAIHSVRSWCLATHYTETAKLLVSGDATVVTPSNPRRAETGEYGSLVDRYGVRDVSIS